MKKLALILFFLAFCFQSYSQVSFEKAYFVDNDNIRTECFIKNKDLYNNPISFEYKLNEDESTVKVGDINRVKEFGILNGTKYVRNFVKMDMSSTNIDKLSEKVEPEWEDKTLFLKVLVEGEATLYEYNEANLKRYFYKLNNSAVEQLVYKKYFAENYSYTKFAVNNEFRKQLWKNLSCGNATMDKFLKIEYTKNDLSNYFVEYNNCKKYNSIDYRKMMSKGSFNLKLKGGIASSSLQIPNESGSLTLDFGNKLGLKLGAEFEYVMSFNRNKWTVYLEPSLQGFKVEKIIKEPSTSGVLFEKNYKWEISYKYVDFAFGLRHYMYLNDNSSLFLNGAFVLGVPMNSTIKKENNIYRNIYTRTGFSYGIGYSYNKKYSIEFVANSNHLDKYYNYSQYETISVVLGYTLFNNKNKSKK